ncbi:MAG: hypothetical protein WC712_04760 [Candidatus Brocadiia bacterium]
MAYRLCSLAIISLLLLFAGCSIKGDDRPANQGEAAKYLADIPVPVGFKMLSTSYSSTSGNTRVGSFLLKGKEHPSFVQEFYRSAMPKLGWEIYSEESTPSGHESLMYMRKSGTVCVIKITRKMRATNIEIQVR